jgi:hypothetical protein
MVLFEHKRVDDVVVGKVPERMRFKCITVLIDASSIGEAHCG